MKSAMMCDLKTLVPFLPPIFITIVIVCAFLTFGGNALGAAASVAVMMVLLCMFSLAGYDDQGGWGRYRATLPFSRREIIAGRYLSVFALGVAGVAVAVVLGEAFQLLFHALLGIPASDASGASELFWSSLASMACGLAICAVAMPIAVKFDAMRGMRLFACAVAILTALVIALGVAVVPPETLANAVSWIEGNLMACLLVGIAISLLAYAVSFTASVAIYERKDL